MHFSRGAMHPSQFPLYGNPGAMSLERERLGIPPGHHVGMDPNDPMVGFNIYIFYSFFFYYDFSLLSCSNNPMCPDFNFHVSLYSKQCYTLTLICVHSLF